MIIPSNRLPVHHLHPAVRLMLITADSVYHEHGVDRVKAEACGASTSWDGDTKTTTARAELDVDNVPAGEAPRIADDIEDTLPAEYTAAHEDPGIVVRYKETTQ
jgi:hypothetical protein